MNGTGVGTPARVAGNHRRGRKRPALAAPPFPAAPDRAVIHPGGGPAGAGRGGGARGAGLEDLYSRLRAGFPRGRGGLKPGPGRAARWWDSNQRSRGDNGEKAGPGAADAPRASGRRHQTCWAAFRARLAEGAARGPSLPLPSPFPGSRKQRLSVCSGAVRAMVPEFYPRRGEGPLRQNSPPAPQSGSCSLNLHGGSGEGGHRETGGWRIQS